MTDKSSHTKQVQKVMLVPGKKERHSTHSHGRSFAPVQIPNNVYYDGGEGGNDLCVFTTQKKKMGALLIRGEVGFRLAQHKTPRPLYTTAQPPHDRRRHHHHHLFSIPPLLPPPSPHGGSHAVLFTGAVLIPSLSLFFHTRTPTDPTKLHLLLRICLLSLRKRIKVKCYM